MGTEKGPSTGAPPRGPSLYREDRGRVRLLTASGCTRQRVGVQPRRRTAPTRYRLHTKKEKEKKKKGLVSKRRSESFYSAVLSGINYVAPVKAENVRLPTGHLCPPLPPSVAVTTGLRSRVRGRGHLTDGTSTRDHPLPTRRVSR